MPKYIFVGSVLFVFVAIITGFLKYRSETCEEYTARLKKEYQEQRDKGRDVYQWIDEDMYECKNPPEVSYTYIPFASPTPIIPRVSP